MCNRYRPKLWNLHSDNLSDWDIQKSLRLGHMPILPNRNLLGLCGRNGHDNVPSLSAGAHCIYHLGSHYFYTWLQGRVCGVNNMYNLSKSNFCPEGYICGYGTDRTRQFSHKVFNTLHYIGIVWTEHIIYLVSRREVTGRRLRVRQLLRWIIYARRDTIASRGRQFHSRTHLGNLFDLSILNLWL